MSEGNGTPITPMLMPGASIQKEINLGRTGHFYKTSTPELPDIQVQLLGYDPATQVVTVNLFNSFGVFMGYYLIPSDRLGFLQYIGTMPIVSPIGGGITGRKYAPSQVSPIPLTVTPAAIQQELSLGRFDHFYRTSTPELGDVQMQLLGYNPITQNVSANLFNNYGYFIGFYLIPVDRLGYLMYLGPNPLFNRVL